MDRLDKRKIEMTNTLSTYPDLMTIADIQHLLQIGRTKAYQLVHSGELQCIRIGRLVRIPKTYLLEYLAESCYTIPQTAGKPSHLKEVSK